MRLFLWTLLWVLGILFPLAFLGKFWPAFGTVFDTLFAPNWVHVVMHAFLFAVLGILLARWMPPTSLKSILALLGLILLFGAAQEAVQSLTAGFWPGWQPEVFDLAVDLAGALTGLGLLWIWNHRPHKSRSARNPA